MKISHISLVFKALRELGPRQVGLFALYRAGLLSGYFRWLTKDWGRKKAHTGLPSPVLHPLLNIPDPAALREILGPEGVTQLKAEADEIVEGRVRLFGGPPVPLELIPPGELSHWTTCNLQSATCNDIKFIWEPARFGWAFTLGRAYHLTGDESYPEAFWRYFEIFSQHNPINMGPNWESAQEVALRMIAFTFAAQVFATSQHSLEPRTAHLAHSIAAHAERIPPTLIYARAQNNNHLLSEAAGLITAAFVLPDHPHAKRWAILGWKWFNRGLETQIASDGAYMQHSTNYHRLMLQLALWVCQVSSAKHQVSRFSELTTSNLQLATRWLLALTDPESGCTPNLGPNDGAYILPLTNLPFEDYRPVLQAASRAFLADSAFGPGEWDEMGLWLPAASRQPQDEPPPNFLTPNSSLTLSVHFPLSWAYLRAAQFSNRPGHADQLHLDLWWRGSNIAQDAGTYLYNAGPPWDNALTHTAVHNTVMVDDCEQMTLAGRFLYLDWAQAEIVTRETAPDGSWQRIAAQHNGYRKLGVLHRRTVTAFAGDRWVIEDRLLSTAHAPFATSHSARLHWLLPDWDFRLLHADCGLQIESPHGKIYLRVQATSGENLQLAICNLQLVRAGQLLHGSGEISPTWGWVSPTYGVKKPALSFAITLRGTLPLSFTTEWQFPE